MTHDESVALTERIRVYEEIAAEFHVDLANHPDFPHSAIGLCAQLEAMFLQRANALKVAP